MAGLVLHIEGHAEEVDGRSGACPWTDCDVRVMSVKAASLHMLSVHCGVQWECTICNERFDLPKRASTCKHAKLLSIPDFDEVNLSSKPKRPKTTKHATPSVSTGGHREGGSNLGGEMDAFNENDDDYNDVDDADWDQMNRDDYDGQNDEHSGGKRHRKVSPSQDPVALFRESKNRAPTSINTGNNSSNNSNNNSNNKKKKKKKKKNTEKQQPQQGPDHASSNVVQTEQSSFQARALDEGWIADSPFYGDGEMREARIWAEQAVVLLAGMGLGPAAIPLKATLAASPSYVRSLGRAQLEGMLQVFVAFVGDQQNVDELWRNFVIEYASNEALGESRPLSHNVLPGPFSEREGVIDHDAVECKLRLARSGLAPSIRVKRKATRAAPDASKVGGPRAARATVSGYPRKIRSVPASPPRVEEKEEHQDDNEQEEFPGESPITSPTTAPATAIQGPPPPSGPLPLQALLDKVGTMMELLEHSDVQMRMMLNLLVTSKRRLADVESERLALKRLLGDANRLLVAAKGSNRDLRVKFLYSDRESKKKLERLSRESRGGYDISGETRDAVEKLSKIRSELFDLCPAFGDEIELVRSRVSFEDESGKSEEAGGIRVTRDLSGRKWASLNDLLECSSPMIARVAASVDLSKLGEVEKIMCFRPFTVVGVDGEVSEYLVSVDWSHWGSRFKVL